MHLNEVSRICGQERVWSLKNCMKCKFMYKAVDKKKKSARINRIHGREVYAGRDMWSCNEDIQKCVVCYEVTKMRMGRGKTKTGSVKNHFLSL